MYGQDNVPHVLTFSSLIGSFSRAYMNPDQAVMESIDNAHKMTQDLSLTECIENRKRLTALLEGEVVPEDKDNPYQVAVGESLAKMMDRIRNFTEYKMWLMDAIWVGRSGIQHRYGWENINGRQRLIPKSQHADDPGWAPIKGDKLVFRYDDGRLRHGEYAHQCGIRVAHNFGVVDRLGRERKLEPVGDGLAVFLKPWERNTMTIHKHMIEDADFHYSHFAGSLHGVGIRSKIYWTWWLKQEALAFMMQYLERSAGGTEIFTYPSGDEKALAQVKQAAMEKSANGRNVIFFPRPPGEDAMAYDYNVVENGMMGLDMMKDLVENYFGGQIKRYILGQQMSTEAHSTGMNSGVSDAHMDTLQQLVRYDACGLSDTLTDQTLRYLQLVNYPETAGWRFRYRLKTDDNDAMARLDAARAAYEMGCKIAEKDVMQIVGLGSPRDGDNVLDVAKSGGGGGMPGMPGLPPDGDGDGLQGQAEVLDDRQHESAGIEQYYRRRVERALAR
jgi:phage gp29-like protein